MSTPTYHHPVICPSDALKAVHKGVGVRQREESLPEAYRLAIRHGDTARFVMTEVDAVWNACHFTAYTVLADSDFFRNSVLECPMAYTQHRLTAACLWMSDFKDCIRIRDERSGFEALQHAVTELQHACACIESMPDADRQAPVSKRKTWHSMNTVHAYCVLAIDMLTEKQDGWRRAFNPF